jgi:hypothetical protein
MPGSWHDSAIALFTEEPKLAVDLVAAVTRERQPWGDLPARVEAPNFNDRPSTDFEADAVITVGPARDPVRGIIVEIQRQWVDTKPLQFARYAAALWNFLRCSVDVLVICPEDNLAARYARPVPTKLRGYTHYPITVSPSDVPMITDPEDAASRPAMAALSVAFHGEVGGVCEAFTVALGHLPPGDAAKYHEHAYNMSPFLVRKFLETLMASTAWPVYSPFAQEHFGKGKEAGRTEGEADAVLRVLEARKLDVTPSERERITDCGDIAQLQAWVTRAVTIERTSDLFE